MVDSNEATSAEAPEESTSQKFVSANAEDVETKPVEELDPKDRSEVSEALRPVESNGKEDVSPEPPAEGNVGSEPLFVPDEEVHEAVEEMISAESSEVPGEPEPVLAPSDVEDGSDDVNFEDVIGVTKASESVDKEGLSPETSSEALISAGADEKVESEGSASLESVSSPANDVQGSPLEVSPEDTSNAEIDLHTEIADKGDLNPDLPPESSTDDVGSADKGDLNPDLPPESSTDDVGSADKGDLNPDLPPESSTDDVGSADKGDLNPDLPPESSTEDVGSADKGDLNPELPPESSTEDVGSADKGDLNPELPPESSTEDVGSADKGDLNPELPPESSTEDVGSADKGDLNPELPPESSTEDAGSVDKGDLNPELPPESSTEDVGSVDKGDLNPELPPESSTEDVGSVDKGDLNPELPPESSTEDAGSVDKEDFGPEFPAEDSSDKVGSESLFTAAEEVHEVVEETISPDLSVGSTSPDSGPASDNLEEEPIGLSEDTSPVLPSESVDTDLPVEEFHSPIEEVGKVEDAATHAESGDLESTSEVTECMPDTKSRELSLSDLKEATSDNVTSTSDSESSEDEKPAIGEGDSSSDAVARDTTPLDVSSPPPAEEKKESPDSFDLHEEVISAESSEVPGEPEPVLAPSDVEDGSDDVNFEDVIGVTKASESVDKEGLSPETSSEALISAGADEKVESEGSASLESVSSPANDVQGSPLEVSPEDTSNAEIDLHTEIADKGDLNPDLPPESSTDDVGSADKGDLNPDLPPESSTDDVGSADKGDLNPDLPPESSTDDVGSADKGDLNPELPPESSTEDAGSVDKGDLNPELPPESSTEDVGSVDKGDLNPELPPESSTEDVGSADKGDLNPELPPESSTEDVGSADKGDLNPELPPESSTEDVGSVDKGDLNPELPPESSTEDAGSVDKEDFGPEFPAEDSSDKVGSESLFTAAEEVHEVVEETISPDLSVGSTSPDSGPASDNLEEEPKGLSEDTFPVLPSESVDTDLPVEEFHSPIEEVGKVEDAATHAESGDLESTSEVTECMPDTKSRELSLNDLKEALSTSDSESSEDEKPAIGEGGSSSDAVARDTTPLDVSSPPPAEEKKESPDSQPLHEEVVHLEEAAEKILEDGKSGDKDGSFAESVAQIVLDESDKTGDSSELISGVIQHVAQLAQDDFQSDPNVLPDTVNQVFDRESAGSPANESGQPKESSSLGTKFSLFVIWCISLCASHVSSKDMPAPTLKLGAEEVATVLHANAEGAASSRAASSV